MLYVVLLACVAPPAPDRDETTIPSPPAPSDPVEVVPGAAETDCGLRSDLASPWFLEGDTVRFTVACTGAVDDADTALTARVLPAGAHFDPETRTYTWTTGPSDGGRYDQVFQVGTGDAPAAEVVTFWVADDPSNPDNVAVDPSRYTEEWGVPVMHLATTAALTDTYSDATATWDGTDYPALVKVHGRTSTNYPKRSYALEFEGAELPVLDWGVRRDHFLLISTFDDNSYARQALTYATWAQMAERAGLPRFTPRTVYTVLYLDGAYVGLYLGLDRIDDEFVDQMGFARDANLYKAVDPDANFYATAEDGSPKKTLHDGYEKAEGEPEDDFADLDALVGFTSAGSTADLLAGSDAWFDREEFIDWFLLVHYANAEDSTNKNVYLHHAPGELFRYIPWDFNASWGQNWRTYRRDPDVANYYAETNRVFAAFFEDSAATAAVWARLEALRVDGGPLGAEWQTAWLDATYARIDPSAQRDWEHWAEAYQSYDEWTDYRTDHDDWTDYAGEKDYLYRWIADRADYYP